MTPIPRQRGIMTNAPALQHTNEPTDNPTWTVRFTWHVGPKCLSHPEHTFSYCPGKTRAYACANAMLNNYCSNTDLKLIAVHVKGPADEWHEVA